MRVDRDQLLELLAYEGGTDAVWIMTANRTTEFIDDPSIQQLAELQSSESWPMYLIRVDLASNYLRDHGLDGSVTLLNWMFSLVPEPNTAVARAAAITGRFLGRRKKQSAQEES